ncbi:hypothetical protein BKA08_002962 [Nocardioides marinisabuli]|uniref:Uncharacterized protein n=1 Tax=Nocardioides marinisabuli TaxID=419476 RepID=A0A7Y9F315_9ACTN|nr:MULTISPECIES: hypothetical protein [Nocardioides]NYD58724.1 hypothetical protein [Nocardioides marinisabuli]
MPRAIAPSVSSTGLGPLRTARGAGRLAVLLFLVGVRLEVDGRLPVELARAALVVEVLRGRVPELPDRVEDPFVDVLVLRDPGGEDVRVAMLATLGERLSRPRD